MGTVYAFENKSQRCFICGETPVDRCHIKSRGAGGSDEDWNVIKMCRAHHQHSHITGWVRFMELFPVIATEFRKRGIGIDYLAKKMIWPRPPEDEPPDEVV